MIWFSRQIKTTAQRKQLEDFAIIDAAKSCCSSPLSRGRLSERSLTEVQVTRILSSAVTCSVTGQSGEISCSSSEE